VPLKNRIVNSPIYGKEYFIQKAVETLEGKWAKGFHFFNEKIQSLMKRRAVL
jgi:hypothetical protein